MKLDHIAYLAQQSSSPQTWETEKWAEQYNSQVAHNLKERAPEVREKWKELYLQQQQPPGMSIAGTEWQALFQPSLEAYHLLANSFFISFRFRLFRAYISKDENDFYVIDNPLVREKVFRWPLIRPTGWKGSLKAALRQLGCLEDNPQIKRLFGDANKTEEGGQAGRLYFYPTFFSKSGLEIINPHDRKTRTGKNPILIECVPQEATGQFTLLYVPFDRIGEDDDKTRREVAEDLQMVAQGIRAMMTEYGFGAKTSSGFGLAEEQLKGQGDLRLKAAITPPAPVEPAPPAHPALPRYLSAPGQLHPDLRADDGGLKTEAEYRARLESQGRKYSKSDKQLYEKAKGWWEREGKRLAESVAEIDTEPALEVEDSPQLASTERTFSNFDHLMEVTTALVEILLRKREEI